MDVRKRYQQEVDHFVEVMENPEQRQMADSWFRGDTVDAWRHRRMYAALDPLLEAYPASSWLTVGDGRFGTDAHYILERGHHAVASNITDSLLQTAQERGFIKEFRRENAEAMSLPDGAFDFVLCKESYHHFPRPMLALYEMLRVAKDGVVLIEPNDAPSLGSMTFIVKQLIKEAMHRLGLRRRLRTADTSLVTPHGDAWEEVGNYVYAISEREIEKVVLGMGYPACAFRGLNDYYEPGVEFEPATPQSALFRKVQEHIATADRHSRKGLSRYYHGMLVAVIVKHPMSPRTMELLRDAGYFVKPTPPNPYEHRTATTA